MPPIPTRDEYIKTLEEIRRKGRDKVGLLGESFITALGLAGGVSAAGTIAGAFGATTLLGSSSLASVLGGVFVTTTPVGWVVGSAVAAGALAYGVGKLIRSGGKEDYKCRMTIYELREKISKDAQDVKSMNKDNEKFKKMAETIISLYYNDKISQDDCTIVLANIHSGKMSVDYAYDSLMKILE